MAKAKAKTSGIDPFTTRRLERFIETFRAKSGQLPTLEDFGKNSFPETLVESALKAEILEQFYVTLTNGTILKAYKLKS